MNISKRVVDSGLWSAKCRELQHQRGALLASAQAELLRQLFYSFVSPLTGRGMLFARDQKEVPLFQELLCLHACFRKSFFSLILCFIPNCLCLTLIAYCGIHFVHILYSLVLVLYPALFLKDSRKKEL